MKKVPFYLVTGFLGSGKTTFLKNFIENFSSEHRIGIIQNEFAPGSVDGAELKGTGKPFDILEVNNGSVFCVCLLGSFVKSLSSFVEEYQPELVILEASGLSDPISISQMLQGSELYDKLYLAHIWCLLDASNFEKMARNLPRIQHQVRVADTVVINKTDVESSNRDEISIWIKYLNPFASIVSTTFSRVNMAIGMESNGSEGEKAEAVAMRKDAGFFTLAGSGAPDLGTFVIKSTKTISADGLEAFLEEFAPASIRIKGFVNMDNGEVLAIQSCYGETECTAVRNYSGPTEVIGIGEGFDQNNIEQGFRRYQDQTY